MVAREKNHPFIVDLEGIEVKATGIRFNTEAHPAEQNVWVTLEGDGVLLKDSGHKEYPLVPG